MSYEFGSSWMFIDQHHLSVLLIECLGELWAPGLGVSACLCC